MVPAQIQFLLKIVKVQKLNKRCLPQENTHLAKKLNREQFQIC